MKPFILFLLILSFLDANALKSESSPYLQQHKNNPVNWYPWGEEALTKAKKEHKLIFLSIGYSTCHWCHVMAYESFEDKEIAELLNKDYIAIKVDREELPHLDKLYQNLHILLKNRSGGWPLTAILTEDAKAFFVGTYIPPTEKYSLEGMLSLLPRLALAYEKNKKEIMIKAELIHKKVLAFDAHNFKAVSLKLDIIKKVFLAFQENFDDIYYGFSYQPKFPESSKIDLLFDLDSLGVEGAKEMALLILREMALHGIYDQVEGGFFRYSVDATWEIPHFEKMLYTNAELIPLYLKAYRLTKDELYKNIVKETIFMIENRFENRSVYFSASDADSHHEEGGFFTYSYEEMMQYMQGLSKKDKSELINDLELTRKGNFINDKEAFEAKTHINFYSKKRPKNFEKIKPNLEAIRKNRDYPFIDKKINTAWNAMMIEALFRSAAIDKKYVKLGNERLMALLRKMYLKGVLYHQTFLEKAPQQKALLEDYAFLISALLEAYKQTYKTEYYYLAKTLSDEAIEKFYAKQWVLSDDDLRVNADMLDKYYTAAMNKMLRALLKLANLSAERKYLDIVKQTLANTSALLKKEPFSYASLMQVLLREKKGYITLKASQENLEKNTKKIAEINYPFVLKKVATIKGYLACDMSQCFAIDQDLRKVIKIIEER